MTDIELVIKIPEEVYESSKRECDETDNYIIDTFTLAIGKGIPLPKGHGDLVDRDKINDRYYKIWKELESYSNKPTYKELLDKWSMCMDTAPTIIKADKTESEDKKDEDTYC